MDKHTLANDGPHLTRLALDAVRFACSSMGIAKYDEDLTSYAILRLLEFILIDPRIDWTKSDTHIERYLTNAAKYKVMHYIRKERAYAKLKAKLRKDNPNG